MRFGKYLRTIREGRRLSLDAVEELSLGFPEQVTKSHLSRIENGQAVPTFPRMFALSQIYGVTISSLAERFETDLARGMLPEALASRPDDELQDEASKLRLGGRYEEALLRWDTILERHRRPGETRATGCTDVALKRVDCLIHLSRYVTAKDECEDMLNHVPLKSEERVVALQLFAICCYRLGKFTFALTAIDGAEKEVEALPRTGRAAADLAMIKGNLLSITGDVERSVSCYTEALKQYEEVPKPFEVCRARLNLSAALIELGRHDEARRHLATARKQAEQQGYDRQLALALSNLGLLAYREKDFDLAEAHCLRSNSLARPREFVSVVFRNCYYLWLMARAKGEQVGIVSNERSLRSHLNRVDPSLPEAQAFRASLSGGEE